MKQVWNPYLPLDKYIPDGEPHVFNDRVYLYGSQDAEGGNAFCVLDYEVFSAPVTDLTDWRSEGIAYRAKQDPEHSEKYRDLYAPDVVQGNDGRYYLYYALAGGCFTGPIHVAVSESPAGPFEYYGCVKNIDGTPFTRKVTFDPGVMNDGGVIRLYFGWSLAADLASLADGALDEMPEEAGNIFQNLKEQLVQAQIMMFEKSKEEIENEPQGVMGAFTVELDDDMLTVMTEPALVVPGQFDADGTGFEGHAFFEASSIRKIGQMYYFIYSSQVCHELCYAVSRYPDKEFHYGGVIISNGDVGYQGRKPEERLAVTGNNHGSIEYIHGQWYVFYHRQTHKTTYSRQGCAEKITILPDGSIPQVEMTSCGLNQTALKPEGMFPAPIACNLTNGHMPHTSMEPMREDIPFITDNGEERYIADITDGTMIGYKYFMFHGEIQLELTLRDIDSGKFLVYTGEDFAGEVSTEPSAKWIKKRLTCHAEGEKALYLKYEGKGRAELLSLGFY